MLLTEIRTELQSTVFQNTDVYGITLINEHQQNLVRVAESGVGVDQCRATRKWRRLAKVRSIRCHIAATKQRV